MKKFVFILLLFISVIIFSSCSSNINSKNDYVMNKIQNINNYKNLNDETIKTLATIYRNDSTDNNTQYDIAEDEILLNLLNSTDYIKLDNLVSINTDSSSWENIINKNEILEFYKNQNIELSNITDIEIVSIDNFAKELVIADKSIDFILFANYFNLKSNKNIKVINNSTNLTFLGYGSGYNYDYELEEIEKMANNGLRYDEIIKNITKIA